MSLNIWGWDIEMIEEWLQLLLFWYPMKYVTCTFEIWILYTLFLVKLSMWSKCEITF